MDFRVILLSLWAIFATVESANILALWVTAGKSHSIQGRALLQGLAERGHNVTMYTTYAAKKQTTNYREIKPNIDIMKTTFGTSDVNVFELMKDFGLSTFISFFTMNPRVSDAILSDEIIQQLIQSKDQYDAVIVCAFLNEPLFAIAQHLKAPLIVYSLSGPSLFTDNLVGNPSPYAYIPGFGHSHPMAFFQRVTNTLAGILLDLVQTFIYFPMQQTVLSKHFPNAPPLFDIMKDTSLVLINSHVSIGLPRPMVPNMIEIGGFQMKKPGKLPADLQQFMDGAKEGVIYFSLGSAVQSKHMPPAIKDSILKSFAKLKQQVLWKWEDEELPGKSKNVKVSKWFPQTDLLAHPNLKLFITHGGWGSICEAISSAVPLIGLPVMGDQYDHVQELGGHGIGLPMDFKNVTEENLSWGINEVINNPSYKEKMLAIRDLYNDREIHPMDKAAYWIEHVIRTKGAKHLRSPALQLNQFQLLLVDVVGFLAFVCILSTVISFYILRKLWNLCCGKKVKHVKFQKKDN